MIGKSRLVLLIELAFLIGVAAQNLIQFDDRSVVWMMISILSWVIFFAGRRWLILVVMIGLFLVGFSYPLVLNRSRLIELAPDNLIVRRAGQLRDSVVGRFGRLLPEPTGSLAAGILVGGQGTLPHELRTAFIKSGTIHITAVSGSNLTIMMKIVSEYLPALGWRTGFLIGSLGLVGFTALAGAGASIVRAAFISWLFLLARFAGRPDNVANALVLAVTLMVIQEPKILTEDVGFQLSIASFGGLIVLDPRLKRSWLNRSIGRRLPYFIIDALTSTISAQLMALPILIYWFGSVSVVSPLTNLLTIPLIPTVMTIASLAVLMSYIAWPVSQLLAYPLWPFLKYIIYINHAFGSTEFSTLQLNGWRLYLVLSGLIIIIFLIVKREKSHENHLPTP